MLYTNTDVLSEPPSMQALLYSGGGCRSPLGLHKKCVTVTDECILSVL